MDKIMNARFRGMTSAVMVGVGNAVYHGFSNDEDGSSFLEDTAYLARSISLGLLFVLEVQAGFLRTDTF